MAAGLFLVLCLLAGFSFWIVRRLHHENVLQERVIAAANCAVLVTDARQLHHPIIYANPAFLLLSGYAECDLLGQTTGILNGPETDRSAIEKLALALQDGRACRVSLRHYRKNGTSFLSEVTLSPIMDRTGRTRSIIWVMHEVSRLRQTEAAFQLSSPAALCDLTSEGMLVTTESEIVYVNRAGVTILGAVSAEQVVGSRWFDMVCYELQEAVHLWLMQAVGSGYSTNRLETKFVRFDGQEVVVALSVSPTMWNGRESIAICFSAISRAKDSDLQSTDQVGRSHTAADSDIWRWTIGNGTEMWSEEHYRVLGYEPGSVSPTYETFKRVLHPEDRDRVLALIEDTFTSDRPYDIECRIMRPGGDVRFVRCRGVLLRGSSDQVIRMSGTIEDVTDYKLLVAMVEERNLQFKTVMESAPIGLLMLRYDGTISLVNSHVERLFGYVRDELLGRPVECLLSAGGREQQDLRAACFSDVGSGPWAVGRESRGLRKDGSEFPIEIRLHSVQESKGKAIIMSIMDLTPRRQADQALEDIKRRFDLVVLSGQVGIFEHDHRSNVHSWSPILREIYGVSTDDVPSLDRYLELVHPGDRERARVAVVRVPDTGREGLYTLQHRILRPDGAVRHLTLRALTSFEGEGSERRPTHTIGMVVDITDHANATIVTRVVEEMETMRTMIGGIAHELNNSLTAVLGFSELALALIPAEAKAHRHINQVITAGRKAREVAQKVRRALDHALSYPIDQAVSSNPDQDSSTVPIEVSDAVGPRR